MMVNNNITFISEDGTTINNEWPNDNISFDCGESEEPISDDFLKWVHSYALNIGKIQRTSVCDINIVNGDGTPFDPPKNPLIEKWNKLYPPIPIPQYSQVCDGYSCLFCGRCPSGEHWEVPEEDKEIYNKYIEEFNAYMILHGNDELLFNEDEDNDG